MRGFELTTNPDVAKVFARYPEHVRPKLERLRARRWAPIFHRHPDEVGANDPPL